VLGWVAIVATVLAGAASLLQLQVVNQSGRIMAFSNNIQVDPFSIFFHLLIAAVVLVTLLVRSTTSKATQLTLASTLRWCCSARSA